MALQLGVIGFGTMGSEIAMLGACAGNSVIVLDRYLDDNDKAMKRLGLTLKRLKRDEKFFAAEQVATDAGRDEILARISFCDDEPGLKDCDFIIEATPEDVELKRAILGALESQIAESTIVASNTSSISITEIAAGISSPQRVIGMHFFNPPSMMNLVELIPGLVTSDETVNSAVALAESMGKRVVRVKETPGFVVNRILLAMLVEAISLAESGISSMAEIDEAMRLGAGWPMGPFKLADLVGLDVIADTCSSIYDELGDPKFRPPFLLRQYVRAGRLGRKTRCGFYNY